MKNLFYRLCLLLGYTPTEHLELRAKLLGYTAHKEYDVCYDVQGLGGETTYWRVWPQIEKCGRILDFYSKREALLYVLKEKGA